MEGVQVYMQETELSKRVQQWEDKIRPILTAEVKYLWLDFAKIYH